MAKRIISIAAVAILLGLYIATLVCAIFATPATKGLFIGSLTMTVVVPIILWVFMALYQRAHARDDEQISLKQMREYRKRIKKGEDPDKIAEEIEKKYNLQEDK